LACAPERRRLCRQPSSEQTCAMSREALSRPRRSGPAGTQFTSRSKGRTARSVPGSPNRASARSARAGSGRSRAGQGPARPEQAHLGLARVVERDRLVWSEARAHLGGLDRSRRPPSCRPARGPAPGARSRRGRGRARRRARAGGGALRHPIDERASERVHPLLEGAALLRRSAARGGEQVRALAALDWSSAFSPSSRYSSSRSNFPTNTRSSRSPSRLGVDSRPPPQRRSSRPMRHVPHARHTGLPFSSRARLSSRQIKSEALPSPPGESIRTTIAFTDGSSARPWIRRAIDSEPATSTAPRGSAPLRRGRCRPPPAPPLPSAAASTGGSAPREAASLPARARRAPGQLRHSSSSWSGTRARRPTLAPAPPAASGARDPGGAGTSPRRGAAPG